eukprot:snap_masked-scaffold_26-processed-gene-1.19-mRNA-1 protein AED:1.00 eAED:1.00 QI:0/-1/0/0/-1/1/1/0/61
MKKLWAPGNNNLAQPSTNSFLRGCMEVGLRKSDISGRPDLSITAHEELWMNTSQGRTTHEK